MRARIAFVGFFLFAAAVVPAAPPAATRPAADSPQVMDVKGTPRRPLDLDGAPAAVFLFVATDCPISNSYAPEINRLSAEYAKVRFYLVYPDRELTDDAARKHAADYGYPCPALLDPRHEWVARFRPKVTPEAVVVGPGGTVLYRGRIDDKWLDYGKARTEPNTHDLRAALDAICAGKVPAVGETKAIGCPVQ